jgi:hypothetical protein
MQDCGVSDNPEGWLFRIAPNTGSIPAPPSAGQ